MNKDNNENIPLQNSDIIEIFSYTDIYGEGEIVTIQGHVKRPAEYVLYENLSLYDLMFLAGGFDDPVYKKATYLERADIIRFDEETQEKQIIPFNVRDLLNNNIEANIPLQGGDVIRVYSYDQMSIKEYVYCYGQVNTPGRYELKQNMNLIDLITAAGSFTDLALIEKIDISNVISSEGMLDRKIFVVDFSDDDVRSYLLKPEDIITVRINPEKRLKKFVHITGMVKYPGTYDLLYERIASLVERAGGLTREAFIEGVRFYRGNQRLSIDLERALEKPESEWNIILITNDSLHIPIKDYSISIEGEVFFPKRIQYKKGEKAGYYIQLAGGYNKNADKGSVKIITPSGTILKTRRFLPDPEVPYGSRIIIPAKQIPEKKEN